MTNSNTSTARIVNSTAPLLKKALQADPKVVFAMVEQSATLPMFESRVIAMNPTNTITAILIL